MKSWALLLCGLLTACASTPSRECDDPGSDRCITLLCGMEACGLYFCEDVQPGRVERSQAVMPVRPPPARAPTEQLFPSSNPQRFWGSRQGLPKHAEPIFIIPWNQASEEVAARLQQDKHDQGKRTWVKHHVFPQEFKTWFKGKGINIHEWTLVIEKPIHERIHYGARGGPWNAAWRQFIEDNNEEAGEQAIHLFAVQLIFRFELTGPIVPYNRKTVVPAFPLAEEDIY
ncbi:SitA6 family polymorphic toxin lipoprotein [Pyxidicoccus xibeiensis]|uniref:SitA6 family polymorphic toxin lipoprotein n=1 Tax=Pyxidicoccus xibeiensis TaxID=2906759 RepID=UPI0020A79BA7|nr:TIGR02269 family lipoprotein [Pyxidicoccus xibeiensis]MCP3135813.1 TIGR02269 family lipoprotein [Pyxidicoccus xibeiensis]